MEMRSRLILGCREQNLEVTALLNDLNAVRPLSNITDDSDIRVRSPKHERILREEWAEAQKTGIDFSKVQFDKLWAKEGEE
jgi:hypothetical protein